MNLSTRVRYSARLMLELALNYGNGPMLLKEIAKRQDISLGYLEHLLPPLKTAGLVNSTRGARGGYSLSKKPSQITLKDITQAMEGTLSLVKCIDEPATCSRVSSCVTRDVWSELEENISNTLEAITLEELVRRQKKKTDNSIAYNI